MITVIIISVVVIIVLLILNFVIPKGVNLREINKIIEQGDYEQAKFLLQKNIHYKKFSPDAHFLLAKVYRQTGQYDYALMELKSIIKNHRFGVMAVKDDIYNMLGQIYLRMGKLDEAYMQYMILEKQHPEEYNVAIKLGKIFMHKKEFQNAINYYQKALKLRNTDAEAIGGLGVCYYLLGDLLKAHDYLDQAVKLNKKNFQAHYYFGLYFYKKQLYDSAIAEYEKAFVDKSLRLRCLYGMGKCYQKKEVNVRAIDSFEQAIRIVEQTADKIRNYNMRIGYLKNPLIIDMRYQLSESYLIDKNFASAIEQWREIKSVNDNYKDVNQKIKENARYGKDRIQDFLIVKEMDFEKIARYSVGYLGYLIKKLKMADKEQINIEAQGNSPEVFQGITLIIIKRSFNPVGERDVRGLIEIMQEKQIKKGLVISANGFSPNAIRAGLGKPIDFVGKHQMMRLLKRYEYRI